MLDVWAKKFMNMLFGVEMRLLKTFLKAHAWLAARPRYFSHGQILCIALVSYGLLAVIFVPDRVGPTIGWVVSSLVLAASGLILRRNLWNDGFEGLKTVGVSLITLAILTLILSIAGSSESDDFLFSSFFFLTIALVIPLWIPFGAGVLIGELQARGFRRKIDTNRGRNAIPKPAPNKSRHPSPDRRESK